MGKFGLWGEVVSTWNSKNAYLLYPGLSVLIAVAPSMLGVCSSGSATVPAWVKDEEAYRLLSKCMQETQMLGTLGILALCTEQVPKIIKSEQEGLLPECVVRNFLIGSVGLLGAFYVGAR